MKNFIVTIDGPAGSGKSTIAKIIAKRYGFTYIDTGAMYRMLTLYSLENNININDENAINNMLKNAKIDISREKFFLNGKNVSQKIRDINVTKYVSNIAAIKIVREKLVDLQRHISYGKKTILDGRDIGTVVFPNANVKIFLVASPEERAKRRLNQYQAKDKNIKFEEVLNSIKERDYLDSTRKESPLIKAKDAIEIDTSNMSIDEVVKEISKYIDKKLGE